MKKKIHHHLQPNWNGWTDWTKLFNKITMACCDCGLAHDLNFKVNKQGKVFWRAKRNKNETKLARIKYKFDLK